MFDRPDSSIDEDTSVLIQRYARALFRYEKLMEISRKLSSTLDLNALLKQIVYSASELTQSEAASIMLLDKRSGVLHFEAAVDTTGFSFYDVDVPIESSIAGWVVTHNEAVRIDDVTQDPRFFRGVDEKSTFQTRTILAVPMPTRNKVIGCMQSLNKAGGGLFSDEDESTLSIMAAQAAIAIENARLFEQSDLISEMVHELRTPLAAIKATTYILDRPDLKPEKHHELLETVARETERLTRMTTDFLDLARLESGRTRLQIKPYDVVSLINEAVFTVQPQAGDYGITLLTEIDPPEMPELQGDAEKIKQVALNLLTNAIKYNREGGTVTLSVLLRERVVEVSVADTGMGISDQNLPHLFEKFYRVTDTEGYTQGTGLGLAIAKRIIEGHGGDIKVDSVAGEGTTFTFTLPLA